MKVGRWTVAGSFILLGIVLLLNHWTEANLFLQLLPWWPVLLVTLGVEILFFYRHKGRTPKFDVIGIVLLALVVIGATVFAGVQGLASALSFDDSILDFLDDDWEEHPLDPFTIPVESQNTLAIKNSNGSIHITAYEGKEIVVEPTLYIVKDGVGTEAVKEFDYTVTQSGQTISLEVPEANNIGIGFSFGDRHWRPVKLDVKVPASFSVDLDSDNGEISVRDLLGHVYVDTQNGKVDVSDIGSDVTLKSNNGLIRAVNIKGAVKVETDNAMVDIDNVGKDVLAQTDTGKIGLKSPQMSGNWEVITDVGKIEVTIPDTASTSIRAETEFGRTSSDFPLTHNRDDVVGGGISTGVIGDGTYDMRLKTSAGSIEIKKMRR